MLKLACSVKVVHRACKRPPAHRCDYIAIVDTRLERKASIPCGRHIAVAVNVGVI